MAFHGARWRPQPAEEAQEGHGHHGCRPCGGVDPKAHDRRGRHQGWWSAHGCQRQVEVGAVARVASGSQQAGLTRRSSTWNVWGTPQGGMVVACGTIAVGATPQVLAVAVPGGPLLSHWDAPSPHPSGQPLTRPCPLEAWRMTQETVGMAAAVLLAGCVAMVPFGAVEGAEVLAAAAASACSDGWPSAPFGPAWQLLPAAAACSGFQEAALWRHQP